MIQIAEKTAKKQQKRVIGRPFKPGQSGNPKGKPKGTLSIKAKIKQIFKKDPKRFKQFIDELIDKQPSLVWQMLEGKPPQDIQLGENPEAPFKYNIIIEKDGTKEGGNN